MCTEQALKVVSDAHEVWETLHQTQVCALPPNVGTPSPQPGRSLHARLCLSF